MIPIASKRGGQPDYGIDAPGVVRGFFGCGAALILAGGLLASTLGWPFSLLGWVLLVLAVVPVALGVSMLLYSAIGKQRLRDHLLRQRVWRGDEIVLDIGAGRGLMAIGAAHRVPHGRVLALDLWSARDLSGNSAEALCRNAALERVERVIEIVTGDARRLDLADAGVDAVVSVFCLHNIEPALERRVACREIARVLKPGGTALIADFPGVAGHAGWLREAGLDVQGPFRADRMALGIAGYLVAIKPDTANS